MAWRICLVVALLSGACAKSATGMAVKETEAKEAPTPAPVDYKDSPMPGLDKAEGAPPARYQRGYDAQGKDYLPRAEHRGADGKPKYTNRLIFETSPYLLQHAHNPVNWYPWGDDAFARAEEEGKLVLLSVGYSTCHWCHVMERESFEDAEIAAYMNSHYVSIKVDREERPDVDKIYMAAVGILVGRGGWPMTVILTPDRLPVFAGTYFPPRDGARGSRTGFLTILNNYRDLYLEAPGDIIGRAQETATRLLKGVQSNRRGGVPDADSINRAVKGLSDAYDPTHGGFSRAPKFPRSVNIELLLRYYHRTRDKRSLTIALETLRKMAWGGMYDHIGGGFHRYSVDARWLVPHFEKMLYDNAQLVVSYLEAYQITREEFFADVAKEILDYVALEMTGAQGAFYSATDADSPTGKGHDEEGLFFTWTIAEVDRLLASTPGSAELLRSYYRMTPRGNFEHRNILHVTRPLEEVAKELKMPLPEATRRLKEAKAVLYKERLTRLPPILDDKILVSWNGLMISAMARGAQVFGREDYARRASQAADFILTTVRDGDRLRRSFRKGQVRHDAYLDDYAFFIQGLLDLYEATFEPRWLNEAVKLQAVLDREFRDVAGGGYYFIGTGTPVVIARDKPGYDGAEPAGNSVAALNLVRLEMFTGEASYRNQAQKLFEGFSRSMTGYGRSVPKMLTALDYYLDEPIQVVIIEPEGASAASSLRGLLGSIYLPNHAFTAVAEKERAALESVMPVIEKKKALRGKSTAYVCRGPICSLPLTEPEKLRKELEAVTPYEKKFAQLH